MKDKSRLIVGGIIMVGCLVSATLVAIFKPELLGSILIVIGMGLVLGYFIATG